MKAIIHFVGWTGICLVAMVPLSPTVGFADPYWASASVYRSIPLHTTGFRFTVHLQAPGHDDWEGQFGGPYWFTDEGTIHHSGVCGVEEQTFRYNPEHHIYAIDYSCTGADLPPDYEIRIYVNWKLNDKNGMVISDFEFLGTLGPWDFPDFGMSYPEAPVPPGPQHDTIFYLLNSDADSSMFVPSIQFYWSDHWQPAEEQWPPQGLLLGVFLNDTPLGPGQYLAFPLTVDLPNPPPPGSFIYAIGEMQYNLHSQNPLSLPFAFGHEEIFAQPTPVAMGTWGRIKSRYR